MTDCIHGPVEGLKEMGVKDAKSYIEIHGATMKQGFKQVSEIVNEAKAYVNQGRWVINCACNGGCLTSPEFKLACCFDCGRVFRNVTFPVDAEKIEHELLKRKSRENRNWNGETVEQLEREQTANELVIV
tara:strand:- start:1734 stop:2123 length:390 start_codon:yes stop_codon:yes gene_type:complete